MLTIWMRRSRTWLAVVAMGVLGCGASSPGGRSATGGTAGAAGGTAGQAAGRAGSGGAGGAAPACSARLACADHDLVCDTDTGMCVECLDDTDCAPQHCDVSQHVCVDCLLSSDCSSATPNCSTGHTCGAACNNSNTCPTDTPVCETSTHTCVECLVNSDCDPNGFCQADRTCR